MRATQVRPTGTERTFGEDEIIVTKTDLRGVLTYANDVFLRISALTEDQAVGQPHSVIRHPDMPRAVFKLLWDTLKDRKELSFDAHRKVVGYHSSRRKPEPAAVSAASELYAKLRAEERRHSSSPAALDAGWKMLQQILADRGQNYDQFVWELTNGGPS
jgi:PAS domain-containing protein